MSVKLDPDSQHASRVGCKLSIGFMMLQLIRKFCGVYVVAALADVGLRLKICSLGHLIYSCGTEVFLHSMIYHYHMNQTSESII